MVVGAFTYGTVARVTSLVGEIVLARTFAGDTIPTDSDIESFLDDTAADIHAVMINQGFTPPSRSSIELTLPRLNEYLRATNSVCAAVVALMSMSQEASFPGTPDGGQTRSQRLQTRCTMMMKRLSDTEYLENSGLSRVRTITDGLTVGSRLDADGNVNKPFFKRGMDDYAGTRSLIE